MCSFVSWFQAEKGSHNWEADDTEWAARGCKCASESSNVWGGVTSQQAGCTPNPWVVTRWEKSPQVKYSAHQEAHCWLPVKTYFIETIPQNVVTQIPNTTKQENDFERSL